MMEAQLAGYTNSQEYFVFQMEKTIQIKSFFNIICINDNAPTIASLFASVLENQTTVSPSSVSASDIDQGNSDGPDQLTFSITGSEVSIDESYGTLTLLETTDYETKSQYSATVTVSDGKFSTSEDIEIYVSNEMIILLL